MGRTPAPPRAVREARDRRRGAPWKRPRADRAPAPWPTFRRAHAGWMGTRLLFLEWLAEGVLWRFRRHALLRLAVAIGGVATVLAGVVGLGLAYLQLRDSRVALDEERRERDRARVIAAWQIVAAGPEAEGNVGRKAAVELLRDRGENLRGINLSHAVLDGIDLSGRNLTGATDRCRRGRRARG